MGSEFPFVNEEGECKYCLAEDTEAGKHEELERIRSIVHKILKESGIDKHFDLRLSNPFVERSNEIDISN